VRRLLLGLVLAAVGLAGCATAQRPDPLEPLNRKVFAFNEGLDKAVLKPTATAYQAVVPRPVRTAATNFFNNIYDVWSAANLFMQGRMTDGLSDLMRFGSNSVFGILGLADVATEMGLERHNEDFGQTLGHWGMGPGAYIVWPVLGPSTVRDSVGLPLELQMVPQSFVKPVRAANSMTAWQLVNTRAGLLQAGDILDGIALDKYVFMRDAYLQRRRNAVYDGDPPPLDDEEDDTGDNGQDDAPDPGSKPAGPAPK
jgi:phospholipid-binding lipoprotein MlaA